MNQLLFADLPSVICTILNAGLLSYLIFVLIWNKQSKHWNIKLLFLVLMCSGCGVAALFRDGYLTLPLADFLTDGFNDGIFVLGSVPVILWLSGWSASLICAAAGLIQSHKRRKKACFWACALLFLAALLQFEGFRAALIL